MIIDFHTHLLPGIDDGSKNTEMSVLMLQEQKRQGVDIVVATPHFYASGDSPEEFYARREEAVSLLAAALPQGAVPRLAFGSEVYYFYGIGNCAQLDMLAICGTRTLLLEMPQCAWTPDMIKELYQLRMVRRYNIVLAHIERYLPQNKKLIVELCRNGTIMQTNTGFFLDRRTRRKALGMLEKGYVHIIGSDCHNLKNRAPEIGPALDMIVKAQGEDAVRRLMSASGGLLAGARFLEGSRNVL